MLSQLEIPDPRDDEGGVPHNVSVEFNFLSSRQDSEEEKVQIARLPEESPIKQKPAATEPEESDQEE